MERPEGESWGRKALKGFLERGGDTEWRMADFAPAR